MALGNPPNRTTSIRGRCSMRRLMAAWCSLAVLAVPANVLAESKEKPTDVPRLGLDPGEPQVRSAPPAMPFAIPTATSKEYVLDFHGYMLLPLRLGLHEREDQPAGGETGLVLHAPPLIPQ